MKNLLMIVLSLGFWHCANAAVQQVTSLTDYVTSHPVALSQTTYRLWQHSAPFANGDTPADIPTLTVYAPQFKNKNNAAVVIAPGGGYLGLASTLEGIEPAAWFTSRGITAFVLTYRVANAARLPAVLTDAARAMRFVRYHAESFGIDPNNIGMMGFSAGGHLTASTALGLASELALSDDAIDQQTSRPDFAILGYPWLEATLITESGISEYCRFANFENIPCRSEDYVQYAPLSYVNKSAPPMFIFHTSDDELVPVAGAIDFYKALTQVGVAAEFHGFAHGAHGSGLGGQDANLVSWGELLDGWLRKQGIIQQRH